MFMVQAKFKYCSKLASIVASWAKNQQVKKKNTHTPASPQVHLFKELRVQWFKILSLWIKKQHLQKQYQWIY